MTRQEFTALMASRGVSPQAIEKGWEAASPKLKRLSVEEFEAAMAEACRMLQAQADSN